VPLKILGKRLNREERSQTKDKGFFVRNHHQVNHHSPQRHNLLVVEFKFKNVKPH